MHAHSNKVALQYILFELYNYIKFVLEEKEYTHNEMSTFVRNTVPEIYFFILLFSYIKKLCNIFHKKFFFTNHYLRTEHYEYLLCLLSNGFN